MKCNFQQFENLHFQTFLGEHAPPPPPKGLKTFCSPLYGPKNVLAHLSSPATFQISPTTFKVSENPGNHEIRTNGSLTLRIQGSYIRVFTVLFQTVFVSHSSEAIFSFLIKKSRQKAIEIETAFFSPLGIPRVTHWIISFMLHMSVITCPTN